MSNQKSPRISSNRQRRLLPEMSYSALAEKAYLHARDVAAKCYNNIPDAYDWPWARLPEPQQKGYVAMVKFIAKELKQHKV